MTSKAPGGITHTYTRRSLSKVSFLLPTLFFSLFSLTFLLLFAPTQFVLGEQSSSVSTENPTANDTGNFAVSGEGGTVSFVDPLLSIDGGSYTISMEEGVTSNSQRIELKGGATVTLDGVTIDDTTDGPAITISGSQDVTILLADGSKNVLKGKAGDSMTYDDGFPGIQKSNSGWLIIGVPEKSDGTGKLEAIGGYVSAGIGGALGIGGTNIKITGGTVTATGGIFGAGIGGGQSGSGSDITISGNAVVTATGGIFGAGIGGGQSGSGSDITISGNAVVTATGGEDAAGIGGGDQENGSNITISGGAVTPTGGQNAAGIGGGESGNGSAITISGGTVMATGGDTGAGIGGGVHGNGTSITISGGVVTATGGSSGSGIGGGAYMSGSNNSITGDNVVVIAESDYASKAALEGFGTIDKGLIFTKQGSLGSWSGNMNNNITLSESLKIPGDLTIPEGKTLLINEGKTLTIPDNSTLKNDGTLTVNGNLSCEGTSAITTRTHFYLLDGTTYGTDDYYQTYLTAAGQQKYTNLPNPDATTLSKSSNDAGDFEYWYYLDTSGNKIPINDTTDVLLNQHTFYEETATAYTITVSSLQNGSITSSKAQAAKDEIVTLTVSPDEGYQLQAGSLKVVAGSTEVALTDKGDGTYTFSMPEANVVVSAAFEPVPEPTPPDPGPSPEPTPDPEPEPTPEPTPGTEDGWVQSDAGWQYVLNGDFLNDGWHYFEDEYGNHWYYFDNDTYMATSRWIWDDGWEGWYWVCSTGPMIENLWQWIDNAWYGFWWGGKMCQGWVWDTAWQEWYYCDDYTGRVACNEWAWDGAWYYFDQNCHMLSSCWVGDYWLNEHGMWV